MARKPTVMTDEEVGTRVLAKSRESVGFYDSKLSKERERVTKYYNGLLPARQHEGGASYVSTDVYDSVEMLHAQILETFGGGDEIAQFDPDQDMNADECRKASLYARYVIFQQNEGFNVFSSVIHDGLMARNGIAKVYWEKKHSFQEETFEGLSYEEAHAEAAQEDVDEFDGDQNFDGTFSGTLTRKRDTSKVTIDNVPPEEFLIEPRASSILKADYCTHRTRKTRAELKSMGFDPKKIENIASSEGDSIDDSPEALARNNATDNNLTTEPASEDMRHVMLYESYIRMTIDSKKGARLYRVCHVDSVLLEEPEEVDKAPFLCYVPLPVPHVFYGNSFAARVIASQNARTVLVRGVLDHTSITNNPRWQVVNGGLLNPREMLENRLGGLVNVRRPDSVAPLPQNNLNPYVFQVLGLLKEDKEQSTGISSLSQGMNKDAISKQNSAGLLDQMVSLSGQREKIAARHFAYNFLVPLMIEVIRLTILNEDKEKIIEVSGGPITITPKAWTERTTCTVSMHLGYGEKAQAAQKMEHAYTSLAGDPALANMFTLQNRYELIRDTLKMAGLNRAASYITAPDKVDPIQPDPFRTKELEIKDKAATAAIMSAEAAQAKASKTIALDTQRLDIARYDQQMNAMDKDRDNNRQDLDTTARVSVAQEELRLEERRIENERVAAEKQAATNTQRP